MTALSSQALETLFTAARSHNVWLDKPVEDVLLTQLYDLTKMPPTSVNCQPLRIIFLKSQEAKEKLKPALAAGNVEKTMSAPVCAILGMDMEFYNHLPRLFPHTDAKSWFAGNQAMIDSTAFRNSSLQGGYFILAARALGLDTGAMSGFDNAKVDELFFAGTSIKSNFLCNLGYGDSSKLYPASPRPEFHEFCKIL
jgi:3-hydroxypropanoate dehydrogenase